MASAYAALRSLKRTLETIKNLTRFSISLDKKQMESLQEKVDFLIDFLETFSHRGNEKTQYMENRMADAAYNTEDAIESHVADEITRKAKTIRLRVPHLVLNKIFFYRFKIKIEKLLEVLDLIKRDSMEIKEMRMMEGWESVSSVSAGWPISTPVRISSMVGFDDDLLTIKDTLTGGNSSRMIIPIVGMGGIGKTTLAKNVYEDKLIVEHFDVRVWVTISQEYDVKRIFLEILNCIKGGGCEGGLGEQIHKSLFGRRYLVILDDMWEIEAWNKLQLFFPDTGNGSRIIVTTRNSHLAIHFGSGVHRLNFLDEDKSWNMFCKEVFGEEGCPVEKLEKIGKKICKDCKGLPLSIVVIGGLLAKSAKTKEYWQYVANDLHSVANLENNESAMKILSLSYHTLPIHLKPCFLYVGAFPEDKEISVSTIIKLWVAEGFLKPVIDKNLEVVGEEYLNDLFSRNLLMDASYSRDINKKFFKIHDSLRDMCLRECQSQKFMHVQCLDPLQCMKRPRRISYHENTSEGEYIDQIFRSKDSLSSLRSLVCHNLSSLDFFPLRNPKMLRILEDSDYYKDIVSLVNSRGITISVNRSSVFKFTMLPSSVNLLWNLQFLIINGQDCVAPSEIWKMTQLRHVECTYLYLPDPPMQDNFVLENLHTLSNVMNFRCTEEVVKRIPNIKHLRIEGKFEEDYFKNLGGLPKLESLRCEFKPEHIPSRTIFQVFPISLKKLELHNIELDWGDLTHIGSSLPNLEVLSLWVSKCTPVWEPIEGEFSCLKRLIIWGAKIVEWRADNTHFPCLEILHLYRLKKLEEIPIGIGEIPTLQSILLMFCSESSILSAKAILDKLEEDFGDVSLQVEVFCKKNEELKSRLTNKNFILRWYRR